MLRSLRKFWLTTNVLLVGILYPVVFPDLLLIGQNYLRAIFIGFVASLLGTFLAYRFTVLTDWRKKRDRSWIVRLAVLFGCCFSLCLVLATLLIDVLSVTRVGVLFYFILLFVGTLSCSCFGVLGFRLLKWI
jgi:drug/metabolite transporter (DMT)-like permease